MDKKTYFLTFKEEQNLLKRLFTFLVFITFIYCFVVSIANYDPDQAARDDFFDLVEQDEHLDVEHVIYALSELPTLKGELPYIDTTIKEAMLIEDPSIFLMSVDSLKKTDKTLDKIRLNKLLNRGHLLLFTGLNLKPEAVSGFFMREEVPVVPLKSTHPLYFHAYGAMYNKGAEQIIPVFYASSEKKNIDINDFKGMLNEFSKEDFTAELLKTN